MSSKKAFILYHDTISVIEELNDEQAGKLIKQIYAYSLHLNNPEKAKKPSGLIGLLNCVFHPFKKQLERDIEAYSKKAKTNRENGKKGGRPKKQENPKKGYKDKDKDKDKDIKKTKAKKDFCLPDFIKPDLFKDYLEMRKKIKKPATDRAIGLIINDLSKFEEAGVGYANLALKNSIKGSWQGVFLPRESKQDYSNSSALSEEEQAAREAIFKRMSDEEQANEQ